MATTDRPPLAIFRATAAESAQRPKRRAMSIPSAHEVNDAIVEKHVDIE